MRFDPRAPRWGTIVLLSAFILFALTSCSSTKPESSKVHPVEIPANAADYVVLAWNDLGMHCLNPTYDTAVLLPPYNTVWAQVIQRGNPPIVVTDGLQVEYRIVNNTRSYGKTDARGGSFGQFWDHAAALFGVELAHDTGLNLDDPSRHNGLAGVMVVKGDHFQVNGMPVTPVDDSGNWSPFQVAEITVKKDNIVVAQTRATVPTSDEINCARCHNQDPRGVFQDILGAHDRLHSTTLGSSTPVLCASCHGSPALGLGSPGSSGKFLSAAIHSAHASRGALCYDCHPGPDTRCNRSLAHLSDDGNCTACHGALAEVGRSIQQGRIPWASEPKCVTCHTGVPEVDTGSTLYRNALGHGGVYCAGCHGSPHAMVPSRQASDNAQPLQYQNSDKTLGSCGTCHQSSRGEGASEFGETHGGSNGRPTACRTCHTQVTADTARWPHAFGWKGR